MHTNFNIIIDLSNYNDVIAIVKCGFNLLDQDQLTNLNVNQNVFNIVKAFIKPTFRFTRLYSNWEFCNLGVIYLSCELLIALIFNCVHIYVLVKPS